MGSSTTLHSPLTLPGPLPIRQVLGPPCSSSSRTWPSDKRSDPAIRADDPACQLLGHAGPPSRRTAMSKKLLGPTGPKTHWTGACEQLFPAGEVCLARHSGLRARAQSHRIPGDPRGIEPGQQP
ncbi:hypothetical protein PSTG_05231 [Puccinia striiformis f. sp. tritici PST-78]|uniref:Uncharacterized protein n=1 Tax=Puccinia striiformis f. sp. tritici PST-78 TaxID=1165861 RepID=A0A0L0VQF2_9BASI|nr:hypothetical protein PSTG_05231 [Puccinia striiformis f. sp. tritici PST-78]